MLLMLCFANDFQFKCFHKVSTVPSAAAAVTPQPASCSRVIKVQR